MQILSWVSKFLLLSFFLDVVSPLSLAQTISPLQTSVCSEADRDLSLDHNQLAGRIPNQIAGLKSLTRLSLSSNGLTGQIPASISSLQNLWYLNLSRNGFSDPLPVIQGRGLPSLLSVDLSNNHLSLGTVPGWIKDRELSDVHLAGCKLQGNLPKFTRPDSLSSLDLSDNLLTGGIAGFFTNMTNLQKLKLSNNQLKFDLSEIKLPDGISSIELQSNQLSGLLSRILNNRTSSFLEVLDVSGNQISGTIPEFGEGLSLKALIIGSNKITGSVPWFNLKPERTGEDRYFKEPHNRHHSNHLGALVESSMARPFYQQPHRENPS
ncbi:DISEASE RESISTANCE PROTEIN-LIKE [Salix koriyanagi]|uniref:DISEASE RESISTANCE PROTEIN-LIKE n=1 Tax=Salix koriyanagi TaxID=2511006 RepID=A0A9Q0UMF4_9ROSI|nr:DISEASE RESISTANCE PROTEIN-LIKE [Salix koriyanagi]